MSWHSVGRLAGVVALQAILLALLALLIPGFRFEDPRLVVPVALILTAGQSLIWPIIYAVASRFGPLLFPLLSFLLTGAIITAAAWVNDAYGVGGVEVADLWTGVLVALGLSAGNTILAAVFSIDDELTYDRMATRPLRRRYANVPRTNEPGFLFLEIDGLSLPVLHDAITRGYMPTLQRWLESGSHQVVRWDPDLSAQTSASQAGILLGSNEGIPAFRWWDKPRQELMVSSQMRSAKVLEDALSTGDGLLAPDGAGRWNAFSGNAADNIGVFSVFGDASRGSDNTLLGYLLTPYLLGRILTLYVIDVFRERWQAWQQRRHNVLPRVHRGWKYAFVRAGTTTAMQEASRFLLTADLLRGVPAIYNTFFSYDEVAHHSGIDREDSLKVLRTIDRIFAHLEQVAREAPRPYHLFVLSDHGQSQGATFLQKYGKTLGEVTNALIENGGLTAMTEIAHDDEAMGHVNAALSQAIHGGTPTARTLRGLLRKRTTEGQVDLWKRRHPDVRPSKGGNVTDVIVLASGNLGVISFPQWEERMSFEQLEEAFPDLLPGLIDHPGIALLLVTSEQHGPLAIGKHGVCFLQSGRVEGEDPLTQFGPHAARHLLREAEFRNVPDIVVISAADPVSGEVPAFEELVGNHGGLGGWQREPFLLYPAEFDPGPEMIVGAGHLHDVLKQWIAMCRKSEAGSRETEDGRRRAEEVPASAGQQRVPSPVRSGAQSPTSDSRLPTRPGGRT